MPEPEPFEDRLNDLMDLCDELRAQGKDPQPVDLTSDPDLLTALKKADADLRYMDAALGGAPAPHDSPARGVPDRYEVLGHAGSDQFFSYFWCLAKSAKP